ncbi:MAG: hypothetical protein HKN74_12900 [Acidimicrobiia bacterium]|nr:hypothetical protein [Acidimicrobiia bacterium]NNF11172.1 hypothetical protein [Acidimicrobiia bacterium]NNL71444.1 hypothetical protein [Acidimicrobiia bacterium]
MLKRTKVLMAAGALVLAVPTGAALADTGEVEDTAVTAVTCDGSQQQLRLADGTGAEAGEQAKAMVQNQVQNREQDHSGECDGTAAGERAQAMVQKQAQVQLGECDGDGPDGDGPGAGNGPRAGDGAGNSNGAAYRNGSTS